MEQAGTKPARVARKWSRSSTVVVMLVVVTMTACNPLSLDWRSRLFDSGHGSATPDNVLTAANVGSLVPKWRLTVPACSGGASGGEWFATPVTFKGVIYIGSARGCLFAIDEATGTVKWSKFTAFQPQQTCTQRLGIVSSISVRRRRARQAVAVLPLERRLPLRTERPQRRPDLASAGADPVVDGKRRVRLVEPNGGQRQGHRRRRRRTATRRSLQGQVRAYDAGTGRLLWAHKTIPDGFTGAGDWYDAAVDAAGNVYVSTGSVTSATQTAHPNTTPGFEQYSVLKLNGSTGALIWKAPAPVPATGD